MPPFRIAMILLAVFVAAGLTILGGTAIAARMGVPALGSFALLPVLLVAFLVLRLVAWRNQRGIEPADDREQD